MSWLDSPTAILLRAELRALLRDRRTLFASIVLPVLLMPLLLFAGQISERGREKRLEAQTFQYALTGEAAAWAQTLLDAAADVEPGENSPVLTLEQVDADDPATALAEQELHFYIRALPAGAPRDRDEAEDEETPRNLREADPEVEIPRLEMVFQGDWDASSTAMREMSRRLREVRSERRVDLLKEAGFTADVKEVLAFEDDDVATIGQRSGRALGGFAVLYVMLFLLTGGAVVAADTIAGEKERGTLETLLTSAIRRREIVTAKQLLILVVGLGITLIQVLNFLVYLKFDIIELPASLAVELSLGQILLLLLLFLPIAALTSSILLWLSGRSKTYKEFQVTFFPVFLLSILPAAASLLPGVTLRSALVLVPVANLSVAIKQILIGEYDLPMIALAFLVTSAAAILAMNITRRTLSEERLMTANSFDRADLFGGAELFPRHVGRWFAFMWGLIFIAAMNQIGGLRGQILFNVVLVFFGGSLLMIYRYRLPVRETLALRPVKPVVWLAVLIGAPSALVANLLVVKASSLIFPVPAEWYERMGQVFAPDDISLLQLIFWAAVLPGICEEVAFRGVLLHGLRKRFSPVVLCLVVGAIFGLFHFDLPRLIPTAMLGVVLSALTLLTGSLYPAIVWHFLNNACAFLAQHFELPLEELNLLSSISAVAILILSGWLIWRHRTVYPGLRAPRSLPSAINPSTIKH